ncbi:MAG TPA: CHAT domain-containing protein, partial [Thermoanaerobaculia bacterium]|nr:CHAT domain-containing protein [Thermoanaerobaculia bacterium]
MNEPTLPQGHPDDETLAAFLDDRLGSAERARVTEHLSRCDACHELFAETVRFQVGQAAARPERRRFPRSPLPWAIGAAAAALLAGVALIRGGGGFRQARPSGPMAELVTALEGERPIEPRLVGGFRYAPPRDVTRGAAPGPTPSWKVLAAAAKVKEQAETSATPDTLSALGVAHLVLGEEDAAVAALEKALKARPKDAALLTDLSAAYLTRAKRKDEPEDIIRALDTADRAIEIDPKIAEPHFNRALALEALGRGEMAKKAWSDYLERDPSSEWAAEARRRLEAIKPARSWKLTPKEGRRLEEAARAGGADTLVSIVSAATGRIADHVEDVLLPRWAAAQRGESRAGATESLLLLQRVAVAVHQKSGDAMLRDAVAAISSARGERLESLAAGHAFFAEAKQRYSRLEVSGASALFSRSKDELTAGGSPYVLWARFYVAIATYFSGDLHRARSEFERLAAEVAASRYKVLAGRIAWMRGLIATREMRHAEAISLYSEALASFESAGDPRRCSEIHALLAGTFRPLGERREEWRHHALALAFVDAGNRPQQASVLSAAALAARESSYLRAALDLQAETVRLSDETPIDRAYAVLFRAYLRHELHDLDRAVSDVEVARAANAAVTDRAIAQRLDNAIDLCDGEVRREREPSRARSSLDRAVEGFRGSDQESFVSALLTRGRASLALGDISAAERDFQEAIDLRESRRSSQESYAIPFFGRSAEVYEEMVRLQAFFRRQPEIALSFVERHRGLDVIAHLAPPDASRAVRPMSPREIRAAMPANTVIVYFSVLPDRLLSWVLRPASIGFYDRRIGAAELRALVSSYHDAMAKSDFALQRSVSGALFDAVLAIIRPSIPDGARLVIVPDEPLHRVAFAGLYDSSRRRFLVQDLDVSLAASGTAFVEMLHRAARDRAPASKFLVVANGTSLRSLPSLASLPAAEQEGAAIARVYPGGVLVRGSAATAERFLADGPRARVLHFVGHALESATDPRLSALVLADDGSGGSGVLSATRIAGVSWRDTDLVVLAGCRTASGMTFKGEGALSLARVFLAGGVHAVIGTLWDV